MADEMGAVDTGIQNDAGSVDSGTQPTDATPVQAQQQTTLVGQAQPVDTNWSFGADDFRAQAIPDEFVNGYTDIVKDIGISKESAGTLLKRAADLMNRLDVQGVERQTAEWIAQARTDSEYGGIGLDANLAIAKNALEQFGGEPLKQVLEKTGLGNHPEVIRFFWKVGKAICEDSFTRGMTGTKPISSIEDAAAMLYPSMKR